MKVNLYVIIGFVLIAVGSVAPSLMATLYVDTSAPTIKSTFPMNGDILTITAFNITVVVEEPDGSMSSCKCAFDGGTSAAMVLQSSNNGIYTYIRPVQNVVAGSHSFIITATNLVGLDSTTSVAFSVSTYSPISGTWYINGVAITSADQVLYSTVWSNNFTFAKSAGSVPDTSINCRVLESGNSVGTLVWQSAGHWSSKFTLSNAKHILSLVADDGTNQYIMSVVTLDLGGSGWAIGQYLTMQNAIIIVGAVLVIYGFTRKKGATVNV
jgi:hypothetical protein